MSVVSTRDRAARSTHIKHVKTPTSYAVPATHSLAPRVRPPRPKRIRPPHPLCRQHAVLPPPPRRMLDGIDRPRRHLQAQRLCGAVVFSIGPKAHHGGLARRDARNGLEVRQVACQPRCVPEALSATSACTRAVSASPSHCATRDCSGCRMAGKGGSGRSAFLL